MKKIFPVALMLFASVFSAKAQEKRINLYGGYVFDNNLEAYTDYNKFMNGTVKGGLQYGGSIEFLTPGETGFEIMYLGQNTTLPLSYNAGFLTGTRTATNDLNLNYALVSINKYARSVNAEGYGGLMLGCLFTDAKNTGISDSSGSKFAGVNTSATRFSWGLKLGANLWLSDHIGIKFQSQFLSTLQAVGEQLYYGGYYGSYYGSYTYLNLFQWSFTTGLVFKIQGK